MIKRKLCALALAAVCIFQTACAAAETADVSSAESTSQTVHEQSSTPDYSDETNWAYWSIGDSKSADLFMICPTVDMKDEDMMSVTDEDSRKHFVGALNTERGIYEESTRMFAPFYRQASMRTTSYEEAEREKILMTAYGDVSAAFAYYLEHENNGRPIILAGFSQGADMCYRLLEEYFGDEELYSQLVAVYAIGWRCTKEMTEKYPQIVPAKGRNDTGVVISFDCEAENVADTFINPSGSWTYSINPLNWKTDSTKADKSENHGACFTGYDGVIKSETAGLCGCYIDEGRGVLKVTDVTPEDYPSKVPGLPEGSYHLYDCQFFFRDLKANVSERLEAYMQAHASEAA